MLAALLATEKLPKPTILTSSPDAKAEAIESNTPSTARPASAFVKPEDSATLEIKLAFNKLEKDKEKKMIITDYQFISVLLGQYDYSVTRFWYNFHGYPTEDNKYF